MAPRPSSRRAVAVWFAAARTLQRGSHARSARRLLLGLVAGYLFVLASPESAVGTAIRRVTPGNCARHPCLAAWVEAPKASSGVARSPRERRAAAARSYTGAADAHLVLSRPPDPLTRVAHGHMAQYGGDLEALTAYELPAAPSAAEDQR